MIIIILWIVSVLVVARSDICGVERCVSLPQSHFCLVKQSSCLWWQKLAAWNSSLCHLLKHILLKQDKLGQDVFLIGSPGPSRRLLAMQYLVNLMINKFLNILYYNFVSPRKHMFSVSSQKFTCRWLFFNI